MHPKLPIWQTLFTSFALFRRHFGFAVRISWPLWAVLAATTIYLGFTSTPEQAPDLASSVSVSLIQGFFFCLVAVYWHRNILLHETGAPAVPVRFDGPFWRYLGYAAVFGLAVSIFSIAIAHGVARVLIFFGVGDENFLAAILMAAAPFFVAEAAVAARVSLVFPAAAVGNTAIGIRRSWQITRGNTWRLIGLALMLLVSGFVIGFGIGIPFGLIGGIIKAVRGVSSDPFIMAGSLISSWIMLIVTFGAISLVYAFLVRGDSSLLQDETAAVSP